MTPLEALDRAIALLDRGFVGGFKAQAFVRARDVIRELPAEEVEQRSATNTLTDLPGIGPATARLIKEALTGSDDIAYLAKLDAETQVPCSPEGRELRAKLKGDCHSHSLWSDGGAPIEAMARAAMALGHEYLVLTDHSPRLTIAHGLSRERLLEQFVELDRLDAELAPFRILRGMEVDILEDGSLDLDDDLLERLDVVVASVHSKLRMDRQKMTERMVLAAASPHVDILGKRPQSVFDADVVFTACAQFSTAVEINCRPERLDPPDDLLDLAVEYGCRFSIDSDAHSPGQLEWQPYGCDKAVKAGIEPDRIINTLGAEDLLAHVA
jgi:putative hydrolase